LTKQSQKVVNEHFIKEVENLPLEKKNMKKKLQLIVGEPQKLLKTPSL